MCKYVYILLRQLRHYHVAVSVDRSNITKSGSADILICNVTNAQKKRTVRQRTKKRNRSKKSLFRIFHFYACIQSLQEMLDFRKDLFDRVEFMTTIINRDKWQSYLDFTVAVLYWINVEAVLFMKSLDFFSGIIMKNNE